MTNATITIKPKRSRRKNKKVIIPQSIKAYVERTIDRNTEDKIFRVNNNFASGGTTILSAANLTALSGSIVPVSPYTGFLDIQQGVGQGGRVGNRIKLKTLKLKGTIYPSRFNLDTNPLPSPVNVIFWFFYARDNPTTLPQSGTDFIQSGNGSSALTNSLVDLWAPINNDKYVLKKKMIFKLGFSYYAGNAEQTIYQSFANNDFKMNQHFSIDLMPHVIQNVIYNDNNSTPTTRGLFWMFQVVDSNGAIQTPATYNVAKVLFSLETTYEDM